mmetsp:Transcript_20208/g.35512  ORF Transcript_20208/g.35512 Transcript_20208/m.35512 type:complete len:260 (+) Transcript_20208:748-1527(+)
MLRCWRSWCGSGTGWPGGWASPPTRTASWRTSCCAARGPCGRSWGGSPPPPAPSRPRSWRGWPTPSGRGRPTAPCGPGTCPTTPPRSRPRSTGWTGGGWPSTCRWSTAWAACASSAGTSSASSCGRCRWGRRRTGARPRAPAVSPPPCGSSPCTILRRARWAASTWTCTRARASTRTRRTLPSAAGSPASCPSSLWSVIFPGIMPLTAMDAQSHFSATGRRRRCSTSGATPSTRCSAARASSTCRAHAGPSTSWRSPRT